MCFVRKHATIHLEEQDFKRIIYLINQETDIYSYRWEYARTSIHVTLVFNGNMYGNSSSLTEPLFYLIYELIRLSPLTVPFS